MIQLPPPKIQLLMEIEKYERDIKRMDADKSRKKEDSSLLWMEVVTRKESYLMLTGQRYIPALIVPRVEKTALLKLFLSLQGHSWSRKNGWIGQSKTLTRPEVPVFEAEPSLYEGVSCSKVIVGKSKDDSGIISSIRLPAFGCRGNLPKEFAELRNCKVINLNWNIIKGCLPRNIGNLDGLQRLCLSGNRLEGTLDPSAFQSFLALKDLDLSFNRLSGAIPDVFESLTNLTALDLSGNDFLGPLPDSMSKLTKLKVFRLFRNHLTGPLPNVSNLAQLQKVNLSQNHFTEGLLTFLACEALETLQLNDNEFTDSIDPPLKSTLRWAALDRLHTLYLHGNQLHGCLTADFCMMTSLQRLNLGSNRLTGALPPQIANLQKLEVLVLEGNSMIGPVPPSIASLHRLRDCQLFKTLPTQTITVPRGFKRHNFNQIFSVAPSVGVDSMCWSDQQLYGGTAPEYTLIKWPCSRVQASVLSSQQSVDGLGH